MLFKILGHPRAFFGPVLRGSGPARVCFRPFNFGGLYFGGRIRAGFCSTFFGSDWDGPERYWQRLASGNEPTSHLPNGHYQPLTSFVLQRLPGVRRLMKAKPTETTPRIKKQETQT